MKNFVDWKWLEENKDREDLILIDARADLIDPLEGINAYNEGHIEGAQFVSLEEVMTGEIDRHGGRHPLPDIDKFTADMKKLGMGNDSTVIIYDDGNIAMAARLLWLLRYFGKKNLYILQGGIKKWIDNGGELTSEIPDIKESDSLDLSINEEMKIDMKYVKSIIDKENKVIVDARSNERYIGKVEPLDRIPGHIPSSLNYPWTELVKDGEILSLDELEDKFKDLKDKEEIVIHCGSGITGIVNLLLMEEIGLKAKLYPGGYSDWISYQDNDVIKEV